MKPKSRITSIAKAISLDTSITGLQTFHLSDLDISTELDFQLPTNLRLGHLAEMIVGELIKSSTNFKVLYENIQLVEDKKTIGEIDFIIKEVKTDQVIHMELAYKFYLYDPTISSEPINNWIGPNRNDSLILKLEKTKRRQFPLLYHEIAKSKFEAIETAEVSQALCLLASLYVPYEYKKHFSPTYHKAIKGYYLSMEKIVEFDLTEKTYYLPTKVMWGMDPTEHTIWTAFENVEKQINSSMQQKQAVLCWQKYKEVYSTFFIVWW